MMRAGDLAQSDLDVAAGLSELRQDIVVGLPKFADETRWEINAKVQPPAKGRPTWSTEPLLRP